MGAWVDKSQLHQGQRAKIVNEATEEPSQFTDSKGNAKNQIVAKVQFENMKEPYNVGLNATTVNGLIDAYGEDSKDWQGHYLTVDIEPGRTAGKKSYTLYLVPEGYEKLDDAEGFAKIVRKGQKPVPEIPIIGEDESIKESDLPF